MSALGVAVAGSSDVHDARGVKCCVCLEEVDYRGTALIRCGRCKIDVHVKCYGKTVPTDGSTWKCEACDYMETPPAPGDRPRLQPNCIVCPSEGGALRRTNQPGIWCHVLCMNWIPELSHSLAGEMNEVLDISVLDRSRQSLKCSICGLKGGCIQCISGRCAKPFHVICAMRVPSDVVFTGYNNENQQVYHCKTHLSDIATFKYEMVDTSWKKSPLLAKLLEGTPQTKSKCRVCSTKVPPNYIDRHEVNCFVAWLAKEETRIRRKQMEELGTTPVMIDFGKPSTPGSSGRSENTPSKNRKNAPMRPCPQCGEQVRETLMMGHMKNNCAKTRNSAKRAKNPAAVNRQHSGASWNVVDLTQEDSPPAAQDLVDVLYATWPGQAAGSLLDSTNFWRILHNNFFSNKVLLRKRMEPLCKNLCGARLEDMGDFSQKACSHDSINCSDTVLFARADDAEETITLNSVVHRCDFMMRNSRMRCVDDLFAKPLVQLSRHCPPETAPDNSTEKQLREGDGMQDIVVRFQNTDGECTSCRFAFRAKSEVVNADSTEVWSRYHPDPVSKIVGAGLEESLPDLGDKNNLWISLHEIEDSPDSLEVTGTTSRDEVTPEINLLVERLREQMRQNRYRVRTLCRKAQSQDYQDESKMKERVAVETYYKEFSLWKALCKSILVGYREFWRVAPEPMSTDVASKSVESADTSSDEDAEEPVDDGTCVVCFDGQSPEANPIIFCDRCDLAVHQRCYGVQHVPSNEFYCDRCRLEDDGRDPAAEVYCQLCPLRDGAFKRTVDGKWVHVVCALWCPGVWIGNLQTLSDIKLVDASHRTRFVDTIKEVNVLISPQSHEVVASPRPNRDRSSLQHGSLCRYCRVACGRTIQCSHPGCAESFHPLCGWFEGYPMTVKLDSDNGYIYSGGGGGLRFTLYCGSHMPEDYTPELRLTQGRNRRRFRIDTFFARQSKLQPVPLRGSRGPTPGAPDDSVSLEEWTDRELCAACFDYASPVPAATQNSQLTKRQLMMRCQYCNTFIHAGCCLSEIDEVSDLFGSNWICERCTLGQAKKTTATGCYVCDRASDYMMPCVGTSSNANGDSAAAGSTRDIDVSSNGSAGDRWIHYLCSRMTKTKLFKRNHMICSAPPVLPNESNGRCDLCQTRGRNLASCGGCTKKFHPTCAARKKYYVNRSNKADWKFFCPTHPPIDVAYDEKRQAWFTGEILAHLHELRHILERGRMIVEMARQRDRQKKRMLNLCSIKKMELSTEMILKKRPTPAMKEIFHQYTGEAMEDVAKREAVTSTRHGLGKSRARPRGDEDDEDEDVEVRRSSRRAVNSEENNKRKLDDITDVGDTPRKRRRALVEEVDATPSRRSSRQGGLDKEAEATPVTPNGTRSSRALSRQHQSVEAQLVGSRRPRNRVLDLTPDEFDYRALPDKLFRVTRAADFDDVVPDTFPELMD